ncbi:MAG: GGDEF domain-containing protein [Magnetospirillum sp.]|nr:GGDEF domain-containing protein [Magnetospirillum sp.]
MRDIVDKVMDDRLRALLARWRAMGVRGDLSSPAAAFPDHRDHLLVIESQGTGHRYVHYGAAFVRLFGEDLTGCVINALPPEILPTDRRTILDFEYTYAHRMGRPLWRAYTAQFEGAEPGDRRTQTWQRLVLPAGGGRLVVGAYPVESDRQTDDSACRLLRLMIDRVPVLLSDDGDVEDLALSLSTFCDSRLQVAELEVLATQDPLTGVANTRHFHRLANLELAHTLRMGRSFSLLALDIDHFKRINDTWGHAAGDLALTVFVDASRMALREYDIVGRVGGEEFAVALPNTGRDGAQTIAERLRLRVAETDVRQPEGPPFRMTVSIGIACCDPPSDDRSPPNVADLLKRADAALYRAKAAGRNRTELSDH